VSALAGLIERVAAGERSRQLEYDIDELMLTLGFRIQRHARPFEAPRYFTSLDAARSLVPEGAWWSIRQFAGAHGSGKEGYHAKITTPEAENAGWGIADTAARALVLAALRARLVA
jgi:hypothetical protein